MSACQHLDVIRHFSCASRVDRILKPLYCLGNFLRIFFCEQLALVALDYLFVRNCSVQHRSNFCFRSCFWTCTGNLNVCLIFRMTQVSFAVRYNRLWAIIKLYVVHSCGFGRRGCCDWHNMLYYVVHSCGFGRRGCCDWHNPTYTSTSSSQLAVTGTTSFSKHINIMFTTCCDRHNIMFKTQHQHRVHNMCSPTQQILRHRYVEQCRSSRLAPFCLHMFNVADEISCAHT